MTEGTTGFPFTSLPSELQREIFVCAAHLNPWNAKQLVLVARRVYTWVQPCIYRLVTLGASDVGLFLRTVDVKPQSFFASNVKQLCLTASLTSVQATKLLEVCTGVESLALWVNLLRKGRIYRGPGSVTPLIAALPLKRLSIEYKHLLDVFYTAVNPPPVWYSTLTHLDLIFWSFDVAPPLPFFTHLQSVTHLSLGLRHSDAPEEYLTSVLAAFRALRILLVFHNQLADPDEFPEPTDIRIIHMAYPTDVVPEWEAWGRETPNVWSIAEEELERRQEVAKSRAGSFEVPDKTALPAEPRGMM